MGEMSERATNIEWNVQCRVTGGQFRKPVVNGTKAAVTNGD